MSRFAPVFVVVIALIAILPSPIGAADGGGRTVTDAYVAGPVRTCNAPHFLDALFGPLVTDARDDGYEAVTGEPVEAFDAPVGACFPLPGGESRAHIQARDASAATVEVHYRVETHDEAERASGRFCDDAELPLPPTAYRLEVYVVPYHHGTCAAVGAGGTTGTVTATFL